ncbi:MAG: DUF4388 domain-containing protein [Acidobacteriia bacterium]|nr:DUF4388 domain-containing protein [Terriglobia bacterium]
MHETSLPEDSAGLVAGRLEGMSIPDLMWLLFRRQATGVLHLSRRGLAKRIFFQDGHIVFAASSDPNDRLGEMLLREGLIDLEQLEDAISKLYLGRRLGTLLVEMGHLRPEDLVRGVIAQVREIVLEPFTWEEGAYRFDDGPLPLDEVVTLGMKTGEILMQGIRRIRSFTRIRRSVGGLRQRFALSPGSAEIVGGLLLTDGERLLLQRLQRGSASIEALCREIYASNFEIHQALWAFRVLGAVTEADGSDGSALAESSLDGRLGPEGIVDVLVKLCRAGETGVLHANRGPLERTFHLREGRCVFATSNSIDDGLIAHLLRRGVISIRDREETARRLLSNKRVGTILLEMGVLDELDLREMVREQLSEIVCDTFRWEEGEYQFVRGELPTIEDIVLESSLEDLVSEGIRRVTSWSRVRAGCGGFAGSRLALTPGYLDVLDHMKVGADEWEVVSCLGAPKTLLDICRSVSLGDFRVCQILWALRLLGAVRDEPASGVSEVLPTESLADRSADSPGPPAAAAGPPEEPPMVGNGVEAAAVEANSIPVSPPEETSPEVVSETWRLTGEAFAASPHEELEPPATGEAACAVRTTEACGDAAGPRSEPAEPQEGAAPSAPEAFALDSPADATLALTRDEVETALGLAPATRHEEEFELAEPGTGADGPFADAVTEDAAGGREFEIGEPAPEASEPEPATSGDAGPSFELAAEDTPPRREEPISETSTPEFPDPESTGAIPPEDVARAIGTLAEEGPAAAEPAPQEAETRCEAFTAESGRAESEAAPETPAAAPVETPEPEHDSPGPLAELDRAIGRFNQLHRVLYRAIRSEVGAGAVNFIHACRGGLDGGQGELFAGSRLLPDGSWDPEGLKKAMRERRVNEPWPRLQRLLDRELEMLRPQIDETRIKALHEQLSELRASP